MFKCRLTFNLRVFASVSDMCSNHIPFNIVPPFYGSKSNWTVGFSAFYVSSGLFNCLITAGIRKLVVYSLDSRPWSLGSLRTFCQHEGQWCDNGSQESYYVAEKKNNQVK